MSNSEIIAEVKAAEAHIRKICHHTNSRTTANQYAQQIMRDLAEIFIQANEGGFEREMEKIEEGKR